ncbi:MarR family transcriptional regulator [Actinoplanes sp. KI2]|uniref:MarR family winged helix-turn-helix transcriptional regulator n=1 Tax=Actinoplanes sp. KI2 TaxID=2983315 RepID=UPI0021D5BCE2|nr:MarR family transcriptional regulator [Actinoplanes sp. KI2]MCU7723518.1 MarR family transcriptional regulator [Actinoplanes sp. KI2]
MADSVDRHLEIWTRELAWLDPLTEAITVRLAMVSRRLTQSRKRALAGSGLQLWQFKTLLALRRLGAPYATSPSRLADAMGLTRGALSARLAPLEEAGLIVRSHDTDDRRRVEVRLTDAGHDACERHLRAENRDETDLLAPLTEDERRTLDGLLRRLLPG